MRRPVTKIVERTALARRLARERAAAVALANGVFDLVHVGHARYLAGARAGADRLIVALNDDVSARRVKGPGRPIVPLEDRLVVVAALRSVDYVTWFPEADVARTLELLRPDVHVKGTDYRPDALPESERRAHARLGIRVAIAGDPKGHATTDLIAAIRRIAPGDGP